MMSTKPKYHLTLFRTKYNYLIGWERSKPSFFRILKSCTDQHHPAAHIFNRNVSRWFLYFLIKRFGGEIVKR
jgi:hypothetical protein